MVFKVKFVEILIFLYLQIEISSFQVEKLTVLWFLRSQFVLQGPKFTFKVKIWILDLSDHCHCQDFCF